MSTFDKLKEAAYHAKQKMKEGDESGLVDLFKTIESLGRGQVPVETAMIFRSPTAGYYEIHWRSTNSSGGPMNCRMNFHEALEWLKKEFDKDGGGR